MRGGNVVVAVVVLLAGPWGVGEGSPRVGTEDLAAASPADEGGPVVEDLAWLAGRWRGEGFGGVCEEVWTPPLGGSMVGLFRLVRGDELVFSEHMMLTAEPDGIVLKVKHFTPEFVAWEEKEDAVRLQLVELRPNEAIFKGLSMRRTEGALEIVLRMKNAAGESRDETLTLRPQP